MTQLSLAEAWAKLERAQFHLDLLMREIDAFQERYDYHIRVEADFDAGRYKFYIDALHDIDAGWGLVIGDCLHNARTALDYLFVQLVALGTGEEPRKISHYQFPVCHEPDRFERAIGKLKGEPAISECLVRIEQLQPFNNGNGEIWGIDRSAGFDAPVTSRLPVALARLAALDNIDKHRVINAAWHGCDWTRKVGPILPPDFRLESASWTPRPLENGAEVGSWHLKTPLPYEWTPDLVDLKRCFPLEVAVDREFIIASVRVVLPFCLWGVHAVLQMFEPVFASRQPPLPVTTFAAAAPVAGS